MKSWWVLLAFLPSLAGSDGDRLFFLNDDTHYIEAVNLDGSGRSRVAIPTVVFPHHIALDHGAGKIYWVDEAVRLNRADLDGGNMEPMYDSVGRAISDLELDLVHQKMYWPVEGELLRANLDGSQIESVNGAVSVHHLTLDLAAGHIYFIETGGNRISRMNLDGSGLTNLLDGLGGPLAGIVLDPVAGNMYWSNGGLDVIQRADLSGGEVENLPISGLNSVEVVGLDPLGQKLYWVDYIFSRIQRSDLDGANQEDLLTSADTIRGVTLDFKGDQFFWGSSPKIQKRAIGGGAITEVMRGQVFNPVDIDVDRVQKKVYWVDADTQTAFRANYDGSAMESLPIPIPRPLTLAVDALAGKLYWISINPLVLQRANLDGSGLETLIDSGLSLSSSLNIDAIGGKLYWIGNGRIQRADLDGANLETLIDSGLQTPRGLTLDTAGGKLYWVDSSFGLIYRADLDGANMEFVLSPSPILPIYAALNPARDTLIWSGWIHGDSKIDIRMVGLDGSGDQSFFSTPVPNFSLWILALDATGADLYWTAAWHNPNQQSCIGSNISILPMIPFITQDFGCP